jgi:hypothetical protein
MGSLEDIYSTSVLFENSVCTSDWFSICFGIQCIITHSFNLQGHRKVSPMFVPKILINMAAGHLTMKFGFKVCLM